MAARTQSKQESSPIDSVKSSTEVPKPQRRSCDSTSRVPNRKNGKNKMKQNSKTTNNVKKQASTAKANCNKKDDNEKGHVDNLISWLTSPLEVDVTAAGDQRNAKTAKVNNSKRTTSNKVISQRNKTSSRTVKKAQPQQRKSVDPPGDESAAEQFLNWLTTPPDLGPNHPHNKQLKKQQQQLTARSSSSPKLQKQIQQQQNQKAKQPPQQQGKQTNLKKKPKNEKMKEFGHISPGNNKL